MTSFVPSRTLTVLTVAIVLAGPAAGWTAGAAQGRRKFEPPPGKTMVLIGCDWSDNFQKYRDLTGDNPAGGVFWYEFNGDTTFFWHNAKDNEGPGGVLAIHFWFADHKTVRELAEGKRDDNIRKIGAAFKEWGRPLYVAIGPEFDHKDNRTKYSAGEFVSTFRRVHRIWDEIGVTNVAYVWHSGGEGLGPFIWEYYPGDEYVDWFGLSLYWLDQIRDAPAFARAGRDRKKPLIIMEGSPVKGGKSASFEEWHAPYLKACTALGARVICYNNFRDHPQIDEPFKHSAFDQLPRPIAEAWGRAMRSPTYLHASPALYETLGVQDQAVARPADEPKKGESKQGSLRIRRVALSIDERGVGELVVDTRAEDRGVAEEPAGTRALAGVPNARVVPKGGNAYRIIHLFKEHEGASDFALRAGVVPLKQEGLAIDRDAGTLILSPARREGKAGMTASLDYPRYLRPPLKLTIDVAEFRRGTLVISSSPMSPQGKTTGTFAVNVSPRSGPDDATVMSAAWRPDVGGKPGDWLNLLEQGVQPDKLIKRGFRLPAGSVSGGHRIPLRVGVAGAEPVSLGRLEVEGVVVPMIGVGFDQGDGGAKVTSVSGGSPAEKAALEAGDVVTAIDGKGIAKFAEATSRVGMARIGQEMRCKIRRGGRQKEIIVKPE